MPPAPVPALLALWLALGAMGASAASLTISHAMAKPDAWFASSEGRTALSNVLSHQSIRGDWPKNIRTAAAPSTQAPSAIQGTFDNNATTGELRLLARAHAAAPRAELAAAILRGIDHILAAQYTNGGWPQYAPPPAKSYHRHITLNDGTLVRLLELMRDVSRAPQFRFVDEARRARAQRAFDLGIDCLVRSQIVVQGRPTVWCAQHDEVTLEPRPGRSYELVSLSGSESAGVLLLLMSFETPSPAIVRAVHGGARWFESAALTGRRETRVNGDKRLEFSNDPATPRLWARFYSIETNRPLYSGRDGIPHEDFAAIEAERRNGYAWHGTWGEHVLARFRTWSLQHPRASEQP